MAEHLHGYPRCETPVGTSCTSSDLHFDECRNHGAIRSCEPSVVDGIPTGQYRCAHDEAAGARPAKKAASKPKAKPKKAKAKAKTKAKAKPKKKAARKGKAARAARKPAKKSRPAARKKGGAKKGARRKKK